MRFPLALGLVAISGFIALSYEIVWYRAYSFVSHSSPASFGVLLGVYLLGIALGSLASRPLCKDRGSTADPRHLRATAVFVYVANLASFLVLPLLGWLITFTKWGASLPAVALAAGALGATFPLICHFGIPPDDQAGARLSYLYLSNIVGAAAGSLVTGFVLLDRATTAGTALLLAMLGLAVVAGLLAMARLPRRALVASAGAVAVTAAALAFAGPAAYSDIWARLLLRKGYRPDRAFAHVVENRSGVITVSRRGEIFGGGVYDGFFSVDLRKDRNEIDRAFALAGLHPAPKEVLMIGLSSGSWAQVVASCPGLERLTVVEINPGYLELIPRFPVVASLLTNPSVEIVIDDGRRWLARHPERRFDAVVMNTTWHWHSHATNLLSTEFLELARRSLKPGGVLYYNTTHSPDVQRTAATVFPHAVRIRGFMAVSDSPLALDKERWRQAMQEWRIDGRPVLDLSAQADRALLEKVLSLADDVDGPAPNLGTETRDHLLARTASARVVTDDNMAAEWTRALQR